MKIAIPLAAVLLLLVIYEYGYVGISSELAEIRARQAVKMQVLRRSVALIEQKPELENQLAALREQVKSRSGNLIAGNRFHRQCQSSGNGQRRGYRAGRVDIE